MLTKLTFSVLAALSLTACGGGGESVDKPSEASNIPIPFVTAVQAQSTGSAGIPAAGIVLDSGPHACDGQSRIWTWQNPYANPIRIVMARQWVGHDYPLESDTHVETHVTAPGGVLSKMVVIQQLDNYKHRSYESERWVNFTPNYIEVPVGGGLRLRVACVKIYGGTNVHATVTIWHF